MIKNKLKKLVPSSKITYTAPKPRLQSVATPEMLRKMKTKPRKGTGYVVPKTPRVSGKGWGGM
jgi:hypothetical protein